MKNDFIKKYGIFIIFVSIILITISLKPVDEQQNTTQNANGFYYEYTNFNNKEDSDTGINYINVDIKENNIYVPLTEENYEEAINSEKFVLLIGSPLSNATRSIVSIFEDVASSYGIDKIYYFNSSKESAIALLEDKEIVFQKESTDLCKKLSEFLKNYLQDYVLIDEKNKLYNTHEKLFISPTIVIAQYNKVIYYEDGFIKDKESKIPLNDNEKNILKDRYKKGFELIKDACDDKC